MSKTRHPREYADCEACGALAPDAWDKKRQLPQVGQTYECDTCGHEVYVYDAGDPGETIRQWRPVTISMVRSLLFFERVGGWPRSQFGKPLQELPEHIAIDYWIVEHEGESQSAWADAVDVSQQAVSKNIAKAREQL